MFPLAKILVPVDFSERSVGAARYAMALARHFHSELVFLHVVAPLRYEFGALEGGGYLGSAGELNTAAAAQARKELDSFLAVETEGLSVSQVVLEGDPALKIVEYGHAENVKLIVMSTHGYGPFRRFILGSVTAKVLHDADCPVWTGVHLEGAPAAEPALRNILCAVDLGPHSERTLRWAAQMAAEFNAPLALVHAAASLEVSGRAGQYFAPEWRGVLITQATEEISKLQQSLGTQAAVYVDSGDVPNVVRLAAERRQADLLVIGRSPVTGLAGRLRAHAYAIIRESPCPVVSV